jgi:anti-sigma-K factor RskA
MKNAHVMGILEAKPFAALDSNDLAQIRVHAEGCESCRQAYEAARLSALLLQERAVETFEPSPFFQTRVLAALRERQTTNETWAWSRLWRTAGGLASSMIAAVATLAILTFVVPGTQTAESPDPATAFNAYSTEAVVLDESALSNDPLSDSEVLTTLYGPDDKVVK